MRIELKEFQVDAVTKLLDDIAKMRGMYRQYQQPTSVCLAAPTGSGKTVICSALIEALFFGNDEIGVLPDESAVVLWLSDSPSLNDQTLMRFVSASDKLADWIGDRRHLEVVGNDFCASHEELEPGHVYFLSKDLLGKGKLLVRGSEANSGRVFWDVLARTIQNANRNLYLFIDEAHRGLGHENKGSRDAATIYANLIDGYEGRPPAPIVVGISATPKRFEASMDERKSRASMPTVSVSPRDVQESGLLKDTIELRVPENEDPVDHQYLTMACERFRMACERWDSYCTEQSEPDVSPLLLVQAQDSVSKDSLKEMCDQILGLVPSLNPAVSFANVFGDHADIAAGRYLIPYVKPELVQDRRQIRVLFAKEAVSNGWDCPRAEVIFSQRRRSDSTYIAQLIGRIVRTPLARRIDADDVLNSVACYLPRFNPESTKDVVDYLTGKKDEMGGSHLPSRNVILNPVTVEEASPRSEEEYQQELEAYEKNKEAVAKAKEQLAGYQPTLDSFVTPTPSVDDYEGAGNTTEVHSTGQLDNNFTENASAGLTEDTTNPSSSFYVPTNPTAPIPMVPPKKLTDRDSSFTKEEWDGIKAAFASIPVRRNPKKARNEFRALLDTATLLMETGLMRDAGRDVNKNFVSMLCGAIIQYGDEYGSARHDIEVAETRKIVIDRLHETQSEAVEEARTDSEGIAKAAREADVTFGGKELANAFRRHIVVGEGKDIDEANLQLAAAVRTPEIVSELENWASNKRGRYFDETNADRDFLSEADRQRYDELERESAGKRLKHIEWPTSAVLSDNYKKYPRHIIQKSDGLCPLDLNDDEDFVVATELGRSRTVGFYRNPSNNSPKSFSIPYSTSVGRLALRPDFIFFVRDVDGKIWPSIIDPHGEFLADTLGKLRGYVEYLREFPDVFKQVLFIGCMGGTERRAISLLREDTQEAIMNYDEVDCKALFYGPGSFPYK